MFMSVNLHLLRAITIKVGLKWHEIELIIFHCCFTTITPMVLEKMTKYKKVHLGTCFGTLRGREKRFPPHQIHIADRLHFTLLSRVPLEKQRSCQDFPIRNTRMAICERKRTMRTADPLEC